MAKRKVLDRINEIIDEEKGCKVAMDSLFVDAELDSLGTLVTLITIDAEFKIFDQDNPEQDISAIDFETFTIRDLVVKCVLSTISTSREPKTENPT